MIDPTPIDVINSDDLYRPDTTVNDLPIPTCSSVHEPFPNVADRDEVGPAERLPAQVHVEADGGGASAFVMEGIGTQEEGSVWVVGVKHQLGSTHIGDTVEVWLPGGNDPHPVEAEVVYIHDRHDRYVARLDPATAEAFRQNYPMLPILNLDAPVGEEIGFTQQVGTPFPVLRHGVIAGDGDAFGGLQSLTGTDGTPGSSGAIVCDREGHIVGQVVAYDPVHHVNLMSTAEQILGDLRDFRDGVNLESRASPVAYDGAACPAVRTSNG